MKSMKTLSGAQVVAEVARRGYDLTPKRFRTIRERVNLRPKQVHVKGLSGSQTRYPASVVDTIEAYLRAAAKPGMKRSIEHRILDGWLNPSVSQSAASNTSILEEYVSNAVPGPGKFMRRVLSGDLIDQDSPDYNDQIDEVFWASEKLTASLRVGESLPIEQAFFEAMVFANPVAVAASSLGQRQEDLKTGIVCDPPTIVVPRGARIHEIIASAPTLTDENVERSRLFVAKMHHFVSVLCERNQTDYKSLLIPPGKLRDLFDVMQPRLRNLAPWIVAFIAWRLDNSEDSAKMRERLTAVVGQIDAKMFPKAEPLRMKKPARKPKGAGRAKKR